MRVLLDTHALLWATLDPASLSRKAARVIVDPKNDILVSAASAWEIATKVRLGRLPGAERLEREVLETMEAAGYTLVPISTEVALRAGRFATEHRDPFDRVIAAQALHEDIPVLSADTMLDSFLVTRIW
ncbi:MAG TPA: type II toxin-antitoxin system VapC family toxin [Terriglobales bacterium]|nr:type II toxin-antitoxin system VapC family toxin [Terriglobales bacterium]